MAEVLVKFTEPVRGSDGTLYSAQACGGIAEDGLWEGWIEFEGGGNAVRTGRETEQPNMADLTYWAQGLSMVYLEGALARATKEPIAETGRWYQSMIAARWSRDSAWSCCRRRSSPSA